MRLSPRLLRLMAVLAVAALMLSGCFQNASESGIQPTDPASAPPTAFAFPTNTPFVPSPTPQVAGDVTEAVPVIELTQQALNQLPTQEPVFQPSPTFEGGLLEGQGGVNFQPTEIAMQPTVSVGMLEMTATAIMAAVQGAAIATPTVFVPAILPSPTVAITPMAGELTATAIIAEATARVGATQTAVSTALGTYVPTATPTLGPTLDPAFLTATALAQPPSQDCTHLVEPGETAYRIARRYGVTLDQIARANGRTNLSLLSIGQQLIIPGCGSLSPTPAVGGQTTTETTSCQQTHLIQPGENLFRIALRYRVNLRALANVNGISNINVIRAGDTLTIPCP
jgi:LysM repeat protein